jgi:hypothetical protein
MTVPPSSPLEENAALRARVDQLEREVAFLRTHPVFVQGLKGETLVATLSSGKLTEFAASHDVVTGTNLKVDVKFSKLNVPYKGAKMRRWNWSKPLGWKDKGKDFDYLLLVGEKDWANAVQYPDDGPYVFFLLPKDKVAEVVTSGAAIGGNVQINTNLGAASSVASKVLKAFLVSEATVVVLLGEKSAVPVNPPRS